MIWVLEVLVWAAAWGGGMPAMPPAMPAIPPMPAAPAPAPNPYHDVGGIVVTRE